MWTEENGSPRCVLVYGPRPTELVRALRRRGIDARPCGQLSAVVDHLVENVVCAVALPRDCPPEVSAFAVSALSRRHPEITLLSVGREVPGVALHLSWPLPRDAVFLQWLEIEGAPLGLDVDEDEATLRDDELATAVDALRTELLATLPA